jgi:hypothetical protein
VAALVDYNVMTSLCLFEISLQLNGWVGEAVGKEIGVSDGIELY